MRAISFLFTVFLLGLFVVSSFSSVSLAADGRPSSKGYFGFWTKIENFIFGAPDPDLVSPYLKEAKIPHNNQWDDDAWKPEYWVDDKGSVEAVIDGFYDARIIVSQFEDKKVPVLEVGKPFLKLSPVDQRHVVEFIDYAFKITETSPKGVFYIALEDYSDKLLGVYTVNGLQLQ